MLDKDREKSTKRDTKIILRNENGVMQVYDWTSDKKQCTCLIIQKGGLESKEEVVPGYNKSTTMKRRSNKKENVKKCEEMNSFCKITLKRVMHFWR